MGLGEVAFSLPTPRVKNLFVFSLIRNIHALTLFDEIRLILAYIRFKVTKRRYPLNILVTSFGLKYKLIDMESLYIISPYFERDYWKFLEPRKDDVFVDVGAHIGKYTMQAARIVGNNGRVIAIEADPFTFRALSDGVIANGFQNVTTLNNAAYDKEREIALHSVPIDGKQKLGKGFSSIKRDLGPSVHVIAKPLDSIVDSLKLTKINFIKIDVEGAELEVIKGARRTLKKFNPILVVEISMATEEILKIMNELGYSSRSIGPRYFCFTPSKSTA